MLPEVHICASLPVADEIHMDCDGFRGIAQDAGSPFLNLSLPSKIVTSCQRETNLNQIWNMKWLITLVVISPPTWVTRTTGWTLFSGNSTQPRAPVLPVLRPFEALSGIYQFAINPKNPKDSTNLIFDASQMIFPSIFQFSSAFWYFLGLPSCYTLIIVAAGGATAWRSYLKVLTLGAEGGHGELQLCIAGTTFNPKRRFLNRASP